MQAKYERATFTSAPNANKNFPYQMENPYDYEQHIASLGEKNYLVSKEISELWLKVTQI